MKPPTALAAKGAVVEEWIDLHFFRPLGFRVATALRRTRVTADHVTLIALVIGLVAGHLMVYNNWRLGLLGFALFVISDIFDSADGQLARMRGKSTRFGRILDGISDNLRFINLYAHLMVRIWIGGGGWPMMIVVVLAGYFSSLQAMTADFMRQAFLRLGTAHSGELDLPEDLPRPPRGFWHRLAFRGYAGYVQRAASLFPATIQLARLRRREPDHPQLALRYEAELRSTMPHVAWVSQNMRFLLVLLTAVPGWPAGFFWLTLIPLNLAFLLLRARQERVAARLVLRREPAQEPAYAG